MRAPRSASSPRSAADDAERIAAEALRRYLEVGIELTETGEELRSLRVIGSPVSEIRLCFDLMPRETAADWDTVAARVAGVPQALDGLREALDAGVRDGVVAARRQAVACAQQADIWGGVQGEGSPFFLALVEEYDAQASGNGSARAMLERAAERATAAYASFGRYLVEEYLPHADERDAVGGERYAWLARSFTGTRLDLHETYAWGWAELHRIEDAMRDVAERILPGQPINAVIDHLETDPSRMLVGEDALRGLAPGAHRRDDRRHARDALRHPRAAPTLRSDDRAARRRRGDVLHGAVRGLHAVRVAPGTPRKAGRSSRSGARSRSATTRRSPAITSRSARCASGATA